MIIHQNELMCHLCDSNQVFIAIWTFSCLKTRPRLSPRIQIMLRNQRVKRFVLSTGYRMIKLLTLFLVLMYYPGQAIFIASTMASKLIITVTLNFFCFLNFKCIVNIICIVAILKVVTKVFSDAHTTL